MNQSTICRSLPLMKKMESAECRLLELTLLLDKNPQDQSALRQYNETAERRKAVQTTMSAANQDFNRRAFPALTSVSKDNWNWNHLS